MQWSVDLNFKSDSEGANLYSLFHRDVSPGCHLDDTIVYDAGKLLDPVNPKWFLRKGCELPMANSKLNSKLYPKLYSKLFKSAGRYSYPHLLVDGKCFSGVIWINGADSALISLRLASKKFLDGKKLLSYVGGLSS